MANEAGISRAHMSDMERGLRLPKLDMLYRICGALDIQIVVLVREIDRNYVRLISQ
jgi:transcriptional regulator with XRE-family HTH domain